MAMRDGLESVAISSSEQELVATFVPGAGMVCCSLSHEGEELLAQRNGVGEYARRGSTMGIPLLYPWANRLSSFSYGSGDDTVELAEASPLLKLDANGLPIHGVIAGALDWELLDQDSAEDTHRLRARMRWERPELLAIFPHPHQLELEARIVGSALTIETVVHAGPAAAVPVSFGYHPYLTIPGTDRGGWQVELPVTTRLLLDERMIPTGISETIDPPRVQLADSNWDDAFSGLVRPAVFVLTGGRRRIELEFLEGYTHAQVFAPPGENFICFEPMTAATNALVTGIDLPWVAPGEQFRSAFRVSVSALG
jgi:aldose 1-epimerase